MLAEKAKGYEAASYKGLFHFVRYIEKLKKYDQDFGEASVEESQKGVRIMSIHKSKGLEFPIVILAGLGKRFNKQDAYSQILLDPNLGAASDWVDLEQRVRIPTLKKQVLKRRMELETLGEELRILYVAMTRAKEKLIMTGTDKALGDKWEKWSDVFPDPWTNSLLGAGLRFLLPGLAAHGPEDGAGILPHSQTDECGGSHRQRGIPSGGEGHGEGSASWHGYRENL